MDAKWFFAILVLIGILGYKANAEGSSLGILISAVCFFFILYIIVSIPGAIRAMQERDRIMSERDYQQGRRRRKQIMKKYTDFEDQ